jgi:hypothetical protein
MRRIATHLLTGIAVLFSSITSAQSVNQSWVQQLYIGSKSNGPKMARDNSGNIYVAATSYPTSGPEAIYVWKYNSSGVIQWTRSYSPPGTTMGGLSTITMDASSNVIVTGTWYYNDSFGHYKTSTVKYNASGTQLWAVETSVGYFFNTAHAITTDAAGNIYITGSTMTSSTSTEDYLTFKLDANGVLQWSATYDGTAGGYDVALAIALDASGNVYITGQSEGQIRTRGLPSTTINTGDDYMTIKYDPMGHILWSNRYYSAQANYSDVASSLVLDASGNAYVTGGANNVGTTVAYSSAGSQLWVTKGASQNNTAIAKDASGNIIVAGYNTAGQGSLQTYYIVKYTSAGAISWTRTYQSGINHNGPYPPLLAVDAQSNVYMAGVVMTAASTNLTGYNFVTMKLSSSGAFIWSAIYNGPTNNSDVPSALVLYQSSSVVVSNYPSVYVAGATDYSGSSSYSTVVKYTQSASVGTSVTEAGSAQGNVLASSDGGLVLANWPNPYKGTTNISYTLPFDSHVVLQVYDMAGKPVAMPVNKREPAGLHTVPFHAGAAGVYSYRIFATSDRGTITATRQMAVQ